MPWSGAYRGRLNHWISCLLQCFPAGGCQWSWIWWRTLIHYQEKKNHQFRTLNWHNYSGWLSYACNQTKFCFKLFRWLDVPTCLLHICQNYSFKTVTRACLCPCVSVFVTLPAYANRWFLLNHNYHFAISKLLCFIGLVSLATLQWTGPLGSFPFVMFFAGIGLAGLLLLLGFYFCCIFQLY